MKRICSICSTVYETYPCKLKKGWQLFCSKLCSSLARGMKVKRTCQVCDKEFIVKRMAIENSGAKYCSHKCMYKAQIGKKIPSGSNHQKWKGGVTLKPKFCIDCGDKLGDHRSTRCKKCAYTLALNHNWQGGISRLPYPFEFNDKLKEGIRKRDDYTCQLCKITEEEHIIIYGKRLSVHHIDYVKTNCKKENLTALCNQCNLRVNYNRAYWTDYFHIKQEGK